MDQQASLNTISRQVLNHSLYEFSKGVRPLFMITAERADLTGLLRQVRSYQVAYYVHPVSDSKINLFFGKPLLVETARRIVNKPLFALTPEEDFILGTLLSYDREQQCERLLKRLAANQPSAAESASITGAQSAYAC